MDQNPYDSPRQLGTPAPGPWRVVWKWTCLGGLLLTATCFVISLGLKPAREAPQPSAAFLVLDGLVALGELSGLVVGGIGGIGWIIARRR